MSTRKPDRFNGWVLGLIGGMLVVVAVNMLMLTIAVKSSRGTIEDNPYEKGMQFDEVLSSRKKMEKSGLTLHSSFQRNSENQAKLTVSISSQEHSVSGYQITVVLTRPSDNRFDRSCNMSEASPGTYECIWPDLPLGLYFLSIQFSQQGRDDHEILLTEAP